MSKAITNNLSSWFVGYPYKDFDTLKQRAQQQIYHPDIKVHTPKGILTYDDLILSQEKNFHRGGYCNLVKIEQLDDNTVEYKVQVCFQDDGTKIDCHAIGTFKDGLLVQVDPITKKEYNQVFTLVKESAEGEIVKEDVGTKQHDDVRIEDRHAQPQEAQ
ncbi:predicted protein [Chaetoceros tenuissimus]|uniref:Uncharacterized protein n=1 Tax=Chaetoceros tenuissimus TaxID=426638 RepID=A0AAD3D0W5_9STRA|nr:predicted protein [Chaetoceros tenuissimus]